MDFKEKLKKREVLLVLGGYGYGNVGDEAQLSADLDDLKRFFPNHIIKILTPNPSYTELEHSGYQVLEAPRIAFYDQGLSKLYDIKLRNQKSFIHFIGNEIFKIRFLGRSLWILINALFIKWKLFSVFLRPKRVSLLNEIYQCDFIFFEGGGYMTGSTLSRLWDGLFFILIARIFGKKVFMSGQTIGVWKSGFNRLLARLALNMVEIISVRDPEDSKEALLRIGVKSEKVKVICDDALFCEKENDPKLSLEGIKYLTYHFHYWGCETVEQKKSILKKNVAIVQSLLRETDLHIVLLSMTPSDEESVNDILDVIHSDRLRFFPHEYNFREIRSLISRSEICITMKHHPIIFAVGECVPVISISYKEYYRHKNGGALKMFNLGDNNIRIEDDCLIESINKLTDSLLLHREEYASRMIQELDHKRKFRTNFFEFIQNRTRGEK